MVDQYMWNIPIRLHVKNKKISGKINFPTYTMTSLMIHLGSMIDRSASYRVTIVALASPKPSFLKIEIKLMLAPKSYKV